MPFSYDLPDPPPGFLTFEESECWTQLKETKIDAERQARDMLLESWARKPVDFDAKESYNDEFEKFMSDLTPQERGGLLLLNRDDYIRWKKFNRRIFAVTRLQHRLLNAVDKRLGI
jgi:hypothetical protein